MHSAMEYASVLSPRTFIRSVTSAGASLTRKVLFPPLPAPPQRPFRVSSSDRSRRKGVVASTLNDLLEKAIDTLLITASLVTLVLEEDGTVVDTEEFFQSLEANTNFLLLEKGQKWTLGRTPTRPSQLSTKKGIANVNFDFYKLNPKDFIGCLNIKATFYEMYSVSCDIQLLGPKRLLRSFLCLLCHLAQAAGHLLLYSGSSLMQWMEDSEEQTSRRAPNS